MTAIKKKNMTLFTKLKMQSRKIQILMSNNDISQVTSGMNVTPRGDIRLNVKGQECH